MRVKSRSQYDNIDLKILLVIDDFLIGNTEYIFNLTIRNYGSGFFFSFICFKFYKGKYSTFKRNVS